VVDLAKGVPVNIHLETKVRQNNDVEHFLFDLKGQVIRMGDTLYIRYKEEQTDGKEAVSVTMKVFPDGSIQLIRSGEMRLRLRFIYRQMYETNYQTPYGVMFFSTYTKDLHFSLADRPTSGKVRIDYDLYMAKEKIGEYQISLDFSA